MKEFYKEQIKETGSEQIRNIRQKNKFPNYNKKKKPYPPTKIVFWTILNMTCLPSNPLNLTFLTGSFDQKE